jgi:hypothetical protein
MQVEWTDFLILFGDSMGQHSTNSTKIPRKIELGAEDCPSMEFSHQFGNTSCLNAQCFTLRYSNMNSEVPELFGCFFNGAI